jgi:hypothetical protein
MDMDFGSVGCARVSADAFEVVSGRLREVQALLRAIDAGELLGTVPATPGARELHLVGVCLLSLMSREIENAICFLDACLCPAGAKVN